LIVHAEERLMGGLFLREPSVFGGEFGGEALDVLFAFAEHVGRGGDVEIGRAPVWISLAQTARKKWESVAAPERGSRRTSVPWRRIRLEEDALGVIFEEHRDVGEDGGEGGAELFEFEFVGVEGVGSGLLARSA
jgi:hypothetical protein